MRRRETTALISYDDGDYVTGNPPRAGGIELGRCAVGLHHGARQQLASADVAVA